MLVEDLKMLVADLFKESEDAVPVLGDGSKKEWIAYYLDNIIDEDGEALQCLLQLDQRADVIDFLEKEYNKRKDKDHEPDLPCDTHAAGNQEKASGEKKHQKANDGKSGIKTEANEDEPTIIVEEEIIIIKDGDDCGC